MQEVNFTIIITSFTQYIARRAHLHTLSTIKYNNARIIQYANNGANNVGTMFILASCVKCDRTGICITEILVNLRIGAFYSLGSPYNEGKT